VVARIALTGGTIVAEPHNRSADQTDETGIERAGVCDQRLHHDRREGADDVSDADEGADPESGRAEGYRARARTMAETRSRRRMRSRQSGWRPFERLTRRPCVHSNPFRKQADADDGATVDLV
jgi:hypothetical protein